MGGALCGLVGLCGEALGGEAGAGEVIKETGLRDGGPEGDFAAGLQGGGDCAEAAPGVDADVFCLNHGGGAVVHIQEDGIVGGGAGFADDGIDIAGDDFHAAIIQQSAIDVLEEVAIPRDDIREQLGDLNAGVTADELQDAPEAVPEAEAPNEHAGIRAAAQAIAGQLREQQLRGGGGGAHQLAAIELEEVLAVVLMQRELRSIGRGGLGEIMKRLHPPSTQQAGGLGNEKDFRVGRKWAPGRRTGEFLSAD